jgi:hypothetical protein
MVNLTDVLSYVLLMQLDLAAAVEAVVTPVTPFRPLVLVQLPSSKEPVMV